ncbi:hypothetical protein AVEN_161922-1 [Araneus ventricosus]|uniref:DNA helicase Pif1-like 2B domain-containing protein n=1 Tax=Araneus ventricosus TaxID=182803 RepID=A0A4Y2SRH6_ARAVE|nr:hypothetical protein AVEN_161922-1 [Araneus ventricosus]
MCEDQEEQNNFQLDFINALTPTGMPPHVLNLKVGAVIMLLRNLNPSAGLCNGTRLIIRKLMPNVIDAEILTGHTKGSRAFIPRITLSPSTFSASKAAVSHSTWFCNDNKQISRTESSKSRDIFASASIFTWNVVCRFFKSNIKALCACFSNEHKETGTIKSLK